MARDTKASNANAIFLLPLVMYCCQLGTIPGNHTIFVYRMEFVTKTVHKTLPGVVGLEVEGVRGVGGGGVRG